MQNTELRKGEHVDGILQRKEKEKMVVTGNEVMDEHILDETNNTNGLIFLDQKRRRIEQSSPNEESRTQ